MQNEPRVSFVCSAKDAEADLERCASSVLRQEIEDIELIIVDDHSKDGTWGLIRRLSDEDARIRPIRNQMREGLTYSLNIGLDFARGEYIARIDADDFAHSTRAVLQAEALERDQSACMAASCYRVVDEEDYEMYCHHPHSDPKMTRWSLCFRNNIRHSTVMWRRSLDMRYDPSFKYSQDYDMWCRMSRLGGIHVVPEILVTIRDRRSSITSTRHNEQEEAADRVAAKQFVHYTGSAISPKQARHMRMLQYLKSHEQMKFFEQMSEQEMTEAAINYIKLAAGFTKKESPEIDSLIEEIKHDLTNCVQNHSAGKRAEAAFLKASEEKETPKWIADEIKKTVEF